MATFEEIKKKHEKYMAMAAGYDNKIGRKLEFLNTIRRFTSELIKLIEQKKVFDRKQRAKFILWRNYWIDLAEPYR